ncbi:MAG TPA: nuclear transport factor 2 family protein [Steroidobacteraceae bacterium]
MKTSLLASFACFAALAATTSLAATDTPAPDALYQKMLALDTAMFDSFNRCEDPAQLAKHAAFFARDVEFYHDLGGVMWGADAVVESTRKNVCGKFRRELDVQSFRVSPIAGYGAITMGTHRFCHTPTTCEGVAEFTMVWKQTGVEWQVTRALSYGHRALEPAPKGK